MNIFFAGNKDEMIFIRDLLNEVLSDPELDRGDCEVQLKNAGREIKVIRTFEVIKPEES